MHMKGTLELYVNNKTKWCFLAVQTFNNPGAVVVVLHNYLSTAVHRGSQAVLLTWWGVKMTCPSHDSSLQQQLDQNIQR